MGRYTVAYSPLGAWPDENSDFVDTSLSHATRQQIASQIVADLTMQ